MSTRARKITNISNNEVSIILAEGNIIHLPPNGVLENVVIRDLSGIAKWIKIELDFLTEISWYFFPIITRERIMEGRINLNGIYIVNEIHELLISWLTPYLYGGNIKNKYKDR